MKEITAWTAAVVLQFDREQDDRSTKASEVGRGYSRSESAGKSGFEGREKEKHKK